MSLLHTHLTFLSFMITTYEIIIVKRILSGYNLES